jgi:hypothetical protein
MHFFAMQNGGRLRVMIAMVLLASVPAIRARSVCSDPSSLSAHGLQVAFAQAKGLAGEHVALYCDRQHADDSSACDKQRYLLGGDQVRIIDQCGQSAYVGYASKSGLATGWVRKDSLLSRPVQEASLDWIAQAASHQPVQQLSLQPPYEAFLQSRVPAARLDLGMSRPGTTPALFSAVEDTTYTAAPELVDERYVVLAACRIHSCDEKGLIWVDLRTNTTVGAVVHFDFGPSPPGSSARRFLLIWSNDVDQRHLPGAFVAALAKWNGGPVKIDPAVDRSTALTVGAAFVAAHYVDRDGQVSAIQTLSEH